MSTTERGRVAEKLAANYLEQRGYDIAMRNWRSKYAEIDLVATKDSVVHIVEVRYRARHDWGSGFESINHDKALRLQNAAASWAGSYNYQGPLQIDIISISGELTRPVIEYIPNALER